jgi:hypothetical protein
MAIEKVITIKGDTKSAVKSFEKLTDTIQEQKDITIEFERELQKLEKQLKDTPKANLQAQKNLKKRIEGLKDAVKDQRLAIKGLNNERVKSNKVTKTSTKDIQENKGAFNLLNKATGGLATRFRDGVNAIKAFNLSLKGTRVAIAATGIGALLLIILSLIQTFKKSEEGQNRFAKLMGVIGSVVTNVTDLLANLGTFIIDLFSGDGQAMSALKSFGKSIFDVVGLPLKTIIDTVKTLGKVMGALFSGNVSAAFDALNEGVQDIKGNFVEAGDAITGAKDALVGFGKEVADDAKKASIIADKRAKADIIDRKLIVERAIATQKINELRLKAEQREKFSAAERIQLLTEASNLEEVIANKKIAAVNLRLEAQKIENTIGLSTKKDLDAIATLQAKAISLDSQKLNLQRLLQTQITTATNDEIAGIKKVSEEKQKALDKEIENEKTRAENIKKFDEKLRNEIKDQDAQTRQEKLDLELERRQEDLDNLIATDEERTELQISLDIIKFNKREKLRKTFAKEEEENKKTAAEEEKKLDENVANAKFNIANNTAGLIGMLAKKGTALAKTAAVAQATISGIKGVQNAYTTAQESPITVAFPAYPLVQAGLAGAFSAVQIKNILSTNEKTGGSSPSIGGGGGSAPSAPSFNLVSGSGSNQIAEGLAGQNQPLKAFVVSSDVSNAQSLDRNIIENSSL